MKYSCIIIVLFFALFVSNVFSQDTLTLINGKMYPIKSYTFSDSATVISTVLQNGKQKEFEKDELLLVKKSDGSEIELYTPQAGEMQFTYPQMKNYVAGEWYAKLHHKPIVGMVGGFALGCASPFLIQRNTFPVPVFVFSLGYSWWLPKNNHVTFDNEYYKMGFKDAARKKRLVHSLLGGMSGLLVGSAAFYFIRY